MVTVRINTGTYIKGVPVFPGDVVEVDEADGRLLVLYKQAEYCEARSEDEPKTSKKKRRI